MRVGYSELQQGASTGKIWKLRRWVKNGQDPLPRYLYKIIDNLRYLEIPIPRFISIPIYYSFNYVSSMLGEALRVFWWTPLFQARLRLHAPHMRLQDGMPCVMGTLTLQFGSRCRVSGHSTFAGRTGDDVVPELRVGDNVDIGWQTTIAVGRRVVIGHNVRIAGRAFLAGYPGHPFDPVARAAGAPDTPDQVGDIILEDDVWLATGAMVMAGVRIGKGTVVAAGSVVTKDLPAYVLAGGVPARVIRSLDGPNGGVGE